MGGDLHSCCCTYETLLYVCSCALVGVVLRAGLHSGFLGGGESARDGANPHSRFIVRVNNLVATCPTRGSMHLCMPGSLDVASMESTLRGSSAPSYQFAVAS